MVNNHYAAKVSHQLQMFFRYLRADSKENTDKRLLNKWLFRQITDAHFKHHPTKLSPLYCANQHQLIIPFLCVVAHHFKRFPIEGEQAT